MTTSNARFVALVDDDAELSIAIASLLRSAGIDVASFTSAEKFLELADRESLCCLVLDLGLPGMGGPELLRRLRASGWCMPIVCISGQPDPGRKLADQVFQAGAQSILYKPFASEELLALLQADDVLRSSGLGSEDTGKESHSGTRGT